MEVLERTQSKVRVTLELEPDEVAVCLCFSGEDLSVEGERTSTTQDMKMEACDTIHPSCYRE